MTRRATITRTDWGTPQPLFDALDREFRFTLDAAASDGNHKCSRYLTEAEDALTADIFDHVVWCNPPYGHGLLHWVQAFRRWQAHGNTVVALLPAATDTDWFRQIWDFADDAAAGHAVGLAAGGLALGRDS